MISQSSAYEQDAVFLPGNIKRIGYDPNTERYLFREGENVWEGEPGYYYGGKMRWAGKAPSYPRSASFRRNRC